MPSETGELSRIVHPFHVDGEVRARPSKSELHRALICAALSHGVSTISNFAYSEDISATMGALESLGLATFETEDHICRVNGGLMRAPQREIDCVESGTTQRLLFPLMLDGTDHLILGRGRLLSRPFGPYDSLCRSKGYRLLKTKDGIEVKGTLSSTDVSLPGDISSQFISGLLIGFSHVNGSSAIRLTTPLESAPYVDMTRDMMRRFGVKTDYDGKDRFAVAGIQEYVPTDLAIEGDHSHAAFFAVAAALAGRVRISGIRRDSLQGDRAIFDILERAGANVVWSDDAVEVSEAPLSGVDVDVSQIPDLVPVLATMACSAKGTTHLRNAARLRHKESDRLASMCNELGALGADIVQTEDSLVIRGGPRLSGGVVHAHNDHRVAMALSVAALASSEPVLINGTNSVRKSAPEFFTDWDSIGGAG